MIQDDWRSCSKCGGLFLDGAASVCAAGGKHDDVGSAHYVLTDNTFVQGSGLGGMWGVLGVSKTGPGVRGQSDATGVLGEGQENGVHGQSGSGRGVYGEATADGDGVGGVSASGTGVFGEGPQNGVHGKSGSGRAVYGENIADGDGVGGVSASGTGVFGAGLIGVHGKCDSGGRAVYGENTANGDAVAGVSASGTGVFGAGVRNGVHGKCDGGGRAVWGENTANGDGVGGFSRSGTGVAGVSGTGTGVYARSDSGPAGYFQGHLEVTGEIRMIGADCAEQFSVPLDIAAGTVMVIDDGGDLAVSHRSYDKRVAGVIVGAGSHRPGLILDSDGEAKAGLARRAISLVGKTYCRVDASVGPISVGDLLTTADVPGCAMRATDHDRAFGAILGKALASLATGSGLIPILVSLQ